MRKNVQAKLKIMIKRLLRKYGYPPDKEKIATDLILSQAKGFAQDWSEEEKNNYYKELILKSNTMALADKQEKYGKK